MIAIIWSPRAVADLQEIRAFIEADSPAWAVYLAQRGLIHPERTRGIAEDETNGLGLMNLFAHVLNFIVRENDNRKAAPSGQYFGRLATGWEKLGP